MNPPKSIGTVLYGWTYDNRIPIPSLFNSRQVCKECDYGGALPNSSMRCNRPFNCVVPTSYGINKKYERFKYAITQP